MKRKVPPSTWRRTPGSACHPLQGGGQDMELGVTPGVDAKIRAGKKGASATSCKTRWMLQACSSMYSANMYVCMHVCM